MGKDCLPPKFASAPQKALPSLPDQFKTTQLYTLEDSRGDFFFLDLKRERSSLVWSLRIRMQRAPCSPWRVLAPERFCSLPHKALSAGWINIGHQERPSTGLQMMFFTKEPRWEATWLAASFAIQAAHCDICGDGQSAFTGKRESSAWSPRVLQVSIWIFSISELLGLRTQCCPLALSFRES